MNRTVRIVTWSVGVLVACVTIGFGLLWAELAKGLSGSWPWETRTPIEYRIPEGYQGWVRLSWGQSGAPQLVKSGNYLIVSFDGSGKAVTSTVPQRGWATDKYFYVSGHASMPLRNTGWCKGGVIWGSNYSFSYQRHDESGKVVYRAANSPEESFFVGSEQAYRRETDPKGTTYYPCK